MNSKWISDINVRAETIKFLEENTRVNLNDLGFINGFLDMAPKSWAAKKKKTKTNRLTGLFQS